jgi:hypothetical protein
LRGYVVLGTRKRKRARSLINLSNGTLIPVNPLRRWVDRCRQRRGIGGLISGKVGSDNFVLSLHRTGILVAFSRVRVDLIQGPRPGQPAQVLPNSLSTFRFLSKRHVSFAVPNELLSMPDVQYRIRWHSGHPNEMRYGIPSIEDLRRLQGEASDSGQTNTTQ